MARFFVSELPALSLGFGHYCIRTMLQNAENHKYKNSHRFQFKNLDTVAHRRNFMNAAKTYLFVTLSGVSRRQ